LQKAKIPTDNFKIILLTIINAIKLSTLFIKKPIVTNIICIFTTSKLFL